MKAVINYVVLLAVVIAFIPVVCWAQLNVAYQEQYFQYNKEIKQLEDAVAKYGNCIERFEIANNQLLGLGKRTNISEFKEIRDLNEMTINF